ncbi:TraR/DksA family transcriptional regulator [Aidingimonas halophila]|uniref:TraR/DksA family transcriptional regulator n=1 Tax=Aidingimonas halophila TaxID=574349 RepID=UPI001E5CD7B2|nr:TraR/DksA family transcriptional regulator [Aidingimonas halophila]
MALNHPELDIDEMRSRLLEERERLQAESESSQSSRDTVVLDQTSVGRLSRMDAMQAQAMAQEEERRRQNALRRIQGALQRIDDDCFGECIECGEWIAAKRLEWDPSVLKCIDCAQ